MRRRSKLFVSCCLSAVTVLTGCGVGNMIFHKHQDTVIPGDVDDPELMNKLLNRPKNGTPAQVDDIRDNLFIAAGILDQTHYWSTAAEGKVQAKVGFIPYDQQVVSRRQINCDDSVDEYFFETNTISAFVKKAEQRFVNENSWLTRGGANPSMSGADYSADNIKAYSESDFLGTYGNYSNGLSNYVLNDFSVLSGELKSSDGGLYTYSFKLDPAKATARYTREVKQMSGASDYPIFSAADITITIDENWVIKKAVSVDSYNISIMGGLNCKSTLTDEFTYSDSYIQIPEKADFSTMFGTITGGEDKPQEKTAMDYLTEAAGPLMTSSEPINGEVSLDVNGSKIPVFVELDLANMRFKVSLGDQVYLIYEGDQVFLSCGEKLNFLVDKSELLSLVKHYLPDFSFDNISLEALLSSDLLGSAMEDMVMTKEESKVKLSLSSAGTTIDINLKLDAAGVASFDTFDITSKADGLSIVATARLFTTDHQYREIPSDVHEITNLEGMAASVDRFIIASSAAGDFRFDLGTYFSISGDYVIDYNDPKSVKALVNIELSIAGEMIPVELRCVQDRFYLAISDSLRVLLSRQELLTLGEKVVSYLALSGALELQEAESLDLESIVDLLDRLVSSITTVPTGISIGLDLAAIDLNSAITLYYRFEDSLFTAELGEIGELTLKPGTRLEIAPLSACNVGYGDLDALIDSVSNFLKFKTFDLEASYRHGSDALSLKAEIDLASGDLQGQLSFDLLSIRGTASFAMEDNKLYFSISDKIKAMLTPEELIQLGDKLQALLKSRRLNSTSLIVFPTPDLAAFSLKEVIDSLTVEEDHSLWVSVPTDWLGIAGFDQPIKACYDVKNNRISASNDRGLTLELTLAPNLVLDPVESTGHLTGAELLKLLDHLPELLCEVGNVDLSLNGTYKGQSLRLTGHLSSTPSRSQLLLTSGSFRLLLTVEGESLYLDFGGAKLRCSLSESALLASNVLGALGVEIPELDQLLQGLSRGEPLDLKTLVSLLGQKLPSTSVDLDQLIKSFTYADEKISLALDLSGKTLRLFVDLAEEEQDIVQISCDDLFLSLALKMAAPEFEAVVPSEHLDLDVLSQLSPSSLRDLVNFAKGSDFELRLAGLRLPVGDKNLLIDGLVQLALGDPQTIKVRGEIFLTYEEQVFALELLYRDSQLYLNFDGHLFLAGDISGLEQFVGVLEDRLGLDLTAPTLDLATTLSGLLQDFNTIVTDLKASPTQVEIDLNLAALGLDATASLTYKVGSGLIFNSPTLGEAKLTLGTPGDYTVPDQRYLGFSDLENYLDKIATFTSSARYEASLSLGIPTSSGTIALDGRLKIDLDRRFDLSFAGSLSSANFFTTFAIAKCGDEIYLDLGQIRIILTVDEVFSLLQKLDSELDLNLPIEFDVAEEALALLTGGDLKAGLQKLLTSFSSTSSAPSEVKVDFKKLLSGLAVSAEKLTFNGDLSWLLPALGHVDLTLDISRDLELSFSSSGVLSNLSLRAADSGITAPKKDGRLDQSGLDKLFQALKTLVSGQGQTYAFTVSTGDKQLAGTVKFTVEEGGFNLALSTAVEGFDLDLYLLDKTLYLGVDGAKVKITLADLFTLIDHLLGAVPTADPAVAHLVKVMRGLERLNPGLLNQSQPCLDLDALLTSFSYADGKIALTIAYQQVKVNLELQLSTEALSAALISVFADSASYDLFFKRQSGVVTYDLDPSSYLDLAPLAALDSVTFGRLAKQLEERTFTLKLDGVKLSSLDLGDLLGVALPSQLDALSLRGEVGLDLSDLSAPRVHGVLYLDYDGVIYELDLDYRQGRLTAVFEGNLRFSDTIAELSSFIEELSARFGLSLPAAKIDLKAVLKRVLPLFNRVVTKLDADADKLNLALDLAPLGYHDALTLTLAGTTGLSINSLRSGALTLEATESISEGGRDPDLYYLDTAELRSYLSGFDALLSSKRYAVNFSAALPSSPLGALKVGGSLVIDLDQHFDLEADLTMFNQDFNLDLRLVKVGETIYIDLGTVKVALTIDDLVALLYRLDGEFSLGLGAVDLTQIGSGLKLLSSGDFKGGLAAIIEAVSAGATTPSSDPLELLEKLDLKSLFAQLSIEKSSLFLTADLNGISPALGLVNLKIDNLQGMRLELSSDAIVNSLTFGAASEKIAAPIIDSSYLLSEELDNIVTKIADIVGFAKRQAYSFSLQGVVKSHGVVNYNYSGKLALDLSVPTDIKMSAQAVVVGPLSGSSMTHNIQVMLVDGTMYGVYNSKLKFKMSTKEMLQLVRYLVDLLGIKSDLLSTLLDGVTEGLDTGVFDPVMPEMKPLDLDINQFLRRVNVAKDEGGNLLDLQIQADCSKLYQSLSGFNPNLNPDGTDAGDNSVLTASIDTSEDRVTKLSVTNIYSQPGETFDLNLEFDNIYDGSAKPVFNAPEDAGSYYDFDSLTELLKQFFVTADIASYSLSGTVTIQLFIEIFGFNIGSIMGEKSLPLTIDIELDEKSVPTVHARIPVEKNISYIVTIIEKGTIDIYYYKETLYIRRGSEYRVYAPADLQETSKIADLVKFIMKPGSIVAKQIDSKMDGGFVVKNPLKFEDILTAYNHSFANDRHTYGLKLAGGALMEENLGDVTLGISTLNSTYPQEQTVTAPDGTTSTVVADKTTAYLNALSLDTRVMGLLNVALSGTLNNIYADRAPTTVDVILPAGLESGSGW